MQPTRVFNKVVSGPASFLLARKDSFEARAPDISPCGKVGATRRESLVRTALL